MTRRSIDDETKIAGFHVQFEESFFSRGKYNISRNIKKKKTFMRHFSL